MPLEDDAANLAAYEYELSDSAEKVAKHILREGLVEAARSVIHMAEHAESEGLRFKAAAYVIERNLGPVAKGVGDKAGWEELFGELKADPST
jgi:hypothetical protein